MCSYIDVFLSKIKHSLTSAGKLKTKIEYLLKMNKAKKMYTFRIHCCLVLCFLQCKNTLFISWKYIANIPRMGNLLHKMYTFFEKKKSVFFVVVKGDFISAIPFSTTLNIHWIYFFFFWFKNGIYLSESDVCLNTFIKIPIEITTFIRIWT